MEEQQKSEMIKFLNASVHHEMLGPLQSNVILTKRVLDSKIFKSATSDAARIKSMI